MIRNVQVYELVERYQGLLFDAYGVLVDGAGAMPGAPALIAELRRIGKPFCVLTNDASRRPVTSAARYRSFGLPIEDDEVITSGSLLAPYFWDHGLSGAKTVVLGPEESQHMAAEAGAHLIAVDGDADLDVLVVSDESGYPMRESLDGVLSMLFRSFDRGPGARLILPNPDLVFPMRPGRFGLAAGSIAQIFERALAQRYPERTDTRFVALGKPHAPIYEAGVRRLGTREVLMIGDQIDTDVRGANDFGIDSALVLSGVGRYVDLPGMPRPTHFLEPFAPGPGTDENGTSSRS